MASEAATAIREERFPAQQPWWRHGLLAVTDLLFPPTCLYCGSQCESRLDEPLLCPTCDAELALTCRPQCPRCAQTCSESEVALGRCRDCRDRKLLFASVRSIGPYQGSLRHAILRSKHAAEEPLAAALGLRLAAALASRPFDQRPDVVAPVPMHWLERLRRKTNPAATIARSLAGRLGMPLARNLLICRRMLKRQALLSPVERRRNVRGAFRISRWHKVAGRRILLVDDVMTTGATAHEASRALLAAGAAAVYVATVSRSGPEQ